jgi:hypothetical protein
MEEMISNSDDICSFLRKHPLISVAGLEKAGEVPAKTITKAMAEQRNIPDIHHFRLREILREYGYENESSIDIDRFRLEYFDEDTILFGCADKQGEHGEAVRIPKPKMIGILSDLYNRLF